MLALVHLHVPVCTCIALVPSQSYIIAGNDKGREGNKSENIWEGANIIIIKLIFKGWRGRGKYMQVLLVSRVPNYFICCIYYTLST